MRKDRDEAIRLRLEGKSYTEISTILVVPKSTLSYWLRKVKINSVQKKLLKERASEAGFRALLARNKLQKQKAKERADTNLKSASLEINNLNLDQLKLIGSALYFAEGGKTPNRVDFTNSNIAMIKIIMRFFRKVCKVNESKFRIQMSIHNKEREKVSQGYWSEATGIPVNQFIKTNLSISKFSKKRRRKKLPFGTIQIRIADVNLFHRIQGWINGTIKQIDNMPG